MFARALIVATRDEMECERWQCLYVQALRTSAEAAYVWGIDSGIRRRLEIGLPAECRTFQTNLPTSKVSGTEPYAAPRNADRTGWGFAADVGLRGGEEFGGRRGGDRGAGLAPVAAGPSSPSRMARR